MRIKIIALSILALYAIIRLLSAFTYPTTYDECRGVDYFLENIFPDRIYRLDFCSYQVSNKISTYKFEKCKNNLGEIRTPDKFASDDELLCSNSYIDPQLVIPSDFSECAQVHPVKEYEGKRECTILTGTGYAINSSIEQKKLGEKLLSDCRQLATSELIDKQMHDTWCRVRYFEK